MKRFLLPLLLASLTTCTLLADDPTKPNPDATKLLTEARQARALWTDFPGFTADVAVTLHGKTHRGTIQVTEKGKVTLADLPDDAATWARGILASAVGHRLSSGPEPKTDCAFVDEDTTHPLGRLVRVLGEEGSSYRVRDHQIMMVNRTMGDLRFSITMLDNHRNEEGKFLPRSYTVHYWDAKTGTLKKTESHHQEWTRQHGLDLPTLVRVLTVDKDVDAREVALTNHKVR